MKLLNCSYRSFATGLRFVYDAEQQKPQETIDAAIKQGKEKVLAADQERERKEFQPTEEKPDEKNIQTQARGSVEKGKAALKHAPDRYSIAQVQKAEGDGGFTAKEVRTLSGNNVNVRDLKTADGGENHLAVVGKFARDGQVMIAEPVERYTAGNATFVKVEYTLPPSTEVKGGYVAEQYLKPVRARVYAESGKEKGAGSRKVETTDTEMTRERIMGRLAVQFNPRDAQAKWDELFSAHYDNWVAGDAQGYDGLQRAYQRVFGKDADLRTDVGKSQALLAERGMERGAKVSQEIKLEKPITTDAQFHELLGALGDKVGARFNRGASFQGDEVGALYSGLAVMPSWFGKEGSQIAFNYGDGTITLSAPGDKPGEPAAEQKYSIRSVDDKFDDLKLAAGKETPYRTFLKDMHAANEELASERSQAFETRMAQGPSVDEFLREPDRLADLTGLDNFLGANVYKKGESYYVEGPLVATGTPVYQIEARGVLKKTELKPDDLVGATAQGKFTKEGVWNPLNTLTEAERDELKGRGLS